MFRTVPQCNTGRTRGKKKSVKGQVHLSAGAKEMGVRDTEEVHSLVSRITILSEA